MMAFLIVSALVVLAVDYAIRGYFQREEDALRTHLRGLGLTDEEIEKRTRQREEALKYYFISISGADRSGGSQVPASGRSAWKLVGAGRATV